MTENTRRLKACIEAWPGCATSEYDPRCCRFPKSCSCDIVHNQAFLDDPKWCEENLEPAPQPPGLVDETTDDLACCELPVTQPDYSWPALIRRAHSLEHAEGWQYAVVWRFAPIEHGHRLAELLNDPPDGSDWEPNFNRADNGTEITKPSWWTEGRPVMHAAYWRRPMPGMVPWMVGSKIHEQRKDD